MPSSYWRNGFALGLTFGICLTLFLIIGFSGSSQVVQAEGDSGYQTNQDEEHYGQEYYLTSWWQHDGAFVSSKDTLAQWVMATLGLIATGLSGWAVILLKKTLRETEVAAGAAQDAVAVTREIGMRQVRAYVAATNIRGRNFADGQIPECSLDFKNTGQSPASQCKVRASIYLVFDPHGDRTKIKIPDPGLSYSRSTIASGDLAGITRRLATPLTAGQVALLNANAMTIVFAGFIIYRDVFGKTRRLTFKFNSTSVEPDGTSNNFRFCGRGNRNN